MTDTTPSGTKPTVTSNERLAGFLARYGFDYRDANGYSLANCFRIRREDAIRLFEAMEASRRELETVAKAGGHAYRELAETRGNETPAFTVEELMHEIHAAHAHTMWRQKPDYRSIPNPCLCRFCKAMGPNAPATLQRCHGCDCDGSASRIRHCHSLKASEYLCPCGLNSVACRESACSDGKQRHLVAVPPSMKAGE